MEQLELKQLSTMLKAAEMLARKISAHSTSQYVQQRLDPMSRELEFAQEILENLLSYEAVNKNEKHD